MVRDQGAADNGPAGLHVILISVARGSQALQLATISRLTANALPCQLPVEHLYHEHFNTPKPWAALYIHNVVCAHCRCVFLSTAHVLCGVYLCMCSSSLLIIRTFGPTLPVARERVAHVHVARLPYRVARQPPPSAESVPMSRAQPGHPAARTNSCFRAKLQKIYQPRYLGN